VRAGTWTRRTVGSAERIGATEGEHSKHQWNVAGIAGERTAAAATGSATGLSQTIATLEHLAADDRVEARRARVASVELPALEAAAVEAAGAEAVGVEVADAVGKPVIDMMGDRV
jgi:hypothetical protein